MDDISIRDHRLTMALDELHTINTWLLGYHASYRAIHKMERVTGVPISTIADVGGGGSTFPPVFNRFRITSIDINPAANVYTLAKNRNRSAVCADALQLPFADNSFDAVHASLFIHHFPEREISLLLKEFLRVSVHGVIINDPLRSIISLAGITLLTKLFSKSNMVKHDAPLSVRRGLTLAEMKSFLAVNGLHNNKVYHSPFFRLMALIYKRRT